MRVTWSPTPAKMDFQPVWRFLGGGVSSCFVWRICLGRKGTMCREDIMGENGGERISEDVRANDGVGRSEFVADVQG
jgi:hypothetical protein